jgi:hypothetical protein
VIYGDSGQANAEIRAIISGVCDRLGEHRLELKYICTNGDPGYNELHTTFFAQWHPIFLKGGLIAAVDHLSTRKRLSVGDFRHIWNLSCRRVENYRVTLSPDSIEQGCVMEEEPNKLLNLGNVLTGKSMIGKIQDALRLFSLKNCATCLRKARMNELTYLPRWALQEEMLRSPRLQRYERLAKAVLSFERLLSYYHLSFFLQAERGSRRFQAETIQAATLAEDFR